MEFSNEILLQWMHSDMGGYGTMTQKLPITYTSTYSICLTGISSSTTYFTDANYARLEDVAVSWFVSSSLSDFICSSESKHVITIGY